MSACSILAELVILDLASRHFTPDHLSVEFVNVGGWLTQGDLTLDSCAQFLAVAEHRLIPSRARYISHQLRMARYQLFWSPACQDQVAGGHARVGVVSLGECSCCSCQLFCSPLRLKSSIGWVESSEGHSSQLEKEELSITS